MKMGASLPVISRKEKNLFFTHLSAKPIEKFIESSNKDNRWIKPKGLYFSVEHGWLEYLLKSIGDCESKEDVSETLLPTNSMYYINKINSDKIIYISSNEDAESFADNFEKKINFLNSFTNKIEEINLGIDWDKVSKVYDGIYIENPRAYYRFYGWDVSTLVIWSTKNTTFSLRKDNSLISTYVDIIFDDDDY